MAEPRDRGEQVRLDPFRLRQLEHRRPLRIHEREFELPTTLQRGLDEVLALGGEQTELLALSPHAELAHELQTRVRRRADHPRHLIQLPWKSQRSRKRRFPPGQRATSSS